MKVILKVKKFYKNSMKPEGFRQKNGVEEEIRRGKAFNEANRLLSELERASGDKKEVEAPTYLKRELENPENDPIVLLERLEGDLEYHKKLLAADVADQARGEKKHPAINEDWSAILVEETERKIGALKRIAGL